MINVTMERLIGVKGEKVRELQKIFNVQIIFPKVQVINSINSINIFVFCILSINK
jgi:hypothetical protein